MLVKRDKKVYKDERPKLLVVFFLMAREKNARSDFFQSFISTVLFSYKSRHKRNFLSFVLLFRSSLDLITQTKGPFNTLHHQMDLGACSQTNLHCIE